MLSREAFQEFQKVVVADPTLLGKQCFPHIFYKPFSKILHTKMIKHFMRSKSVYTIAKCPRGTGKSVIVAFLLTFLAAAILDKHYIVVLSDTMTKACQMLEDLKMALKTPDCMEIFGDLEGTAWGAKRIHLFSEYLGIDCFIEAKAMLTQIRGARHGADRIQLCIVDDPEDDEDSDNPALIEKKKRWVVKSLEPALVKQDANGMPGQIWWLGTTISKHCLINKVSEFEDANVIRFPILQNGKSIWEEMFPTADLLALRNRLFRRNEASVWYSEYILDPKSENEIGFQDNPHYFHPDDVKSARIPLYMTVDAAYSLSKSADKLAIAVGGFDENKTLYSFESWSGRVTTKRFIEQVVKYLRYYQSIGKPIVKIGIESLAFEIYHMVLKKSLWEQLGLNTAIVPLKPKGRSKVARIQVLTSYDVDGCWLIRREHKVLGTQREFFPSDKYGDDEIDAHAYLLDIAKAPKTKGQTNEGRPPVGSVARAIQDDLRQVAMERVLRSIGGHGSRGVPPGMARTSKGQGVFRGNRNGIQELYASIGRIR